MDRRFAPIFLLLLASADLISSEYMEVKGPPIAAQKEVQHIFRRGENVKVTCPITGTPAPMIEWSKDGEHIGFMWERHRASRRALKIRNAHEDDTGVYVCRGVNGFGTEEVRVVLHVVDPRQFPDQGRGGEPAMAPPVFTTETRHAQKFFRKAVGDTFRAACEALGSPQPEIFWFKDGRHIHEPVRGAGNVVELGIMSAEDAGVYSCRARNLAGERTVNFTLEVQPGLASPTAIVTEVGPDPAEVPEGGSTVLRCKVKALERPSVKWLKRVEGAEADASDALTVGSKHYRVLENSVDVALGSDVYQTRLELRDVSRSDAGMYICFVTGNSYGFTFKSMNLKVTERQQPDNIPRSSPPRPTDPESVSEPRAILILVICLSVVVFVLLVCILVCVIRKRAKTPPSAASAASEEARYAEAESPDLQRPFMAKQQQQPLMLPPGGQMPPPPVAQHWGRTPVYPEYTQQQQQQYMKLMAPPTHTDSGFDASLSTPSPKEDNVSNNSSGGGPANNQYEVPYAHLMASQQQHHHHLQHPYVSAAQQQQQLMPPPPRPYQFSNGSVVRSSNNGSVSSGSHQHHGSHQHRSHGSRGRVQYPEHQQHLRRGSSSNNNNGSSGRKHSSGRHHFVSDFSD